MSFVYREYTFQRVFKRRLSMHSLHAKRELRSIMKVFRSSILEVFALR